MKPYLSGGHLSGADLSRANLGRVNLDGADLLGANLTGADLSVADLRDANLGSAYLREADLSGATLCDAYFHEADLRDANLSRVHLSRANFFRADPRGAYLTEATLSGTNFFRADLRDAYFDRAILIKTNLTEANLTNCWIYGISVWDVQLQRTKQNNLVITDDNQPSITVDNVEIAQFIYLLLNYQKIRQTIDTITSQVVLLLGRFPPERKEVIDVLSKELRGQKYSPVVFNFEGAGNKDFTATVRTLASMARFVLLDLMDVDEAIREVTDAIVLHCVIPIQPLLFQGPHRQEYELIRELQRKYRWVLAPSRYKDMLDLQSGFQEKILQPINEKMIELKQKNPLKIFIGYAPEEEAKKIMSKPC